MYDALFISLILHVVISFMPSQTTKQQTMVLTRTTKGSSDCSDVNNLTPILLFYFQHTSGFSIFCSDPSPRASYGPSGVLQLLVTSGYYSSIDATTIPPGLNPGYKMSIVQSTLACSLVPTVMLSQYTSITVLVTSTWWLSLTVDHFCFAKFKKTYSAPNFFLNYFVHVSPFPSIPSLNTIAFCADMKRVQLRISSFGFSHNQTVYRLFYPIVRFFYQKLELK